MKNVIQILLVLALTLSSSFAFALTPIANVEFAVNHGDVFSPKVQLGSWVTRMHPVSLQCVYDFSKQGGAQGVIYLKGIDGQNCVIPKGYIVDQAYLDVVTQLTSGGSATISVGTGLGATDIKNALAVASWTVSIIAGTPVGTAATAIKMTAEKSPYITIATADLTAGKFVAIFNLQPSL